jgi:hypothetical protein
MVVVAQAVIRFAKPLDSPRDIEVAAITSNMAHNSRQRALCGIG